MSGPTIAGISPFHDFFFRSCFYNSFFAVLRYFEKDIYSVMVENIALYRHANERHWQLDLKYVSFLDLKQIVEQLGITVNMQESSDDLVGDIKRAISNGDPVIIWVDCYELPNRLDTYKRVHWEHTLLVYGYDDERNVFQIFDQQRRDHLRYEPTEISYESLVRANGAYRQFFPKGDGLYSIYSFHCDRMEASPSSIKEARLRTYLHHLHSQREEIRESFDHLNRLSEQIMASEAALPTQLEDLLSLLNEIIHAKKSEQYLISELGTEAERFLQEKSSEIVQLWTIFRSQIAKYIYTDQWNAKNIQALEPKLQQIKQLEASYLEQLLDLERYSASS